MLAVGPNDPDPLLFTLAHCGVILMYPAAGYLIWLVVRYCRRRKK